MYRQPGLVSVDWIHYIILLGGVTLVACLCYAAFQTSVKIRRAKASQLADDLEMELLASDNPNTLIVAGEINDRPSTIRFQHERSSLDLIRNGFANHPVAEAEELLVSVECACAVNFKIEKSEEHESENTERVAIALLKSHGLSLESNQKEKAASIFEEPETVKSLIDLLDRSGARRLMVSENKVSALIFEASDAQRSPARVASILESLDKFARLLEFVADEHHSIEN
ncbi:MAG TPA: hypothetical protein PKZ32_22565 [Candidatus Melainabacteria bacterium]|nr:hypothetical protein [Candidatus Melainabacteria bacterium]